MDLICDQIIQHLQNEQRKETVDININLVTTPTIIDSNYNTSYSHNMKFDPVIMKNYDEDLNYLLTVSGVSFYPKREVVKSFVSSWLEDMTKQASINKIDIEFDLEAIVGHDSSPIYKDSLTFCYFPNQCTKNKRNINRIVERVMKIKHLCDNLV
ncbi:hypothetical protein TetV_187 [Tetraselmis virus 1]|uniref:Uncharacterized protein n=1 Tax=Tetraselmis virus 1 TaxID=2060617 RepID=A0A2P0VNG0_9VIRU|nr:hypothetical protein QJ968_gp187 [Tetraselmis virus 1]AUF82279.1 hypothetical protein TetV_187 [Tetraselmis virus 1]